MLILALDSTALSASVSLFRDAELVAAFQVKNGNTHSATLLPMVKALLDATGTSADDIDLFACSEGPGSFTGVRIGVATVKGLAFGKEKPVLGVSTLAALAASILPHEGLICPVMNARRGQAYNALFLAKGNTLERLCPDRAIALDALMAELAMRDEPVAFVGDGAALASAAANGIKEISLPLAVTENPAVGVALLAREAYLAGARGTDATLSPVYLRLPQAERERLAREAKETERKETT